MIAYSMENAVSPLSSWRNKGCVVKTARNRTSPPLDACSRRVLPRFLGEFCCRRVASITVTRAGAQPSYPRGSDLPPDLQLPLKNAKK